MSRDEMIEVMARGIVGSTSYEFDGPYIDACSDLARAALSALEAAGGAVVPAALLKEYRPTMAEDVLRHWAAELAASQQEKTDAG